MARSNISPTRTGDQPGKAPDTRDADVHADDPDVEDNGLEGEDLLVHGLGATVIDEIAND
jgi:DNA polymerase-3 subunit gamma/tau